MMRGIVLIVTGFLFFALPAVAQVTADTSSDVSKYEYMFADTASGDIKPVYKPVLGIGRGAISFLGDVRDNYSKHPVVGRQAWMATVSRAINPFIKLNFVVTYGKLTGNHQNEGKFVNFQSEMLCGTVNASYNFYHLFKKPQRLYPYISLGVESYEFNSKADMYDANGAMYHLWSDGTLRNVEESQGSELTSVILQRDYNYETDLRELDLDGKGKYPLVAFALPIDIGFDMALTDRLSFRAGTVLHITFSDNVDNVSAAGEGDRAGKKGGDKFLFTYVSFHYDLFSPPKDAQLRSHYSDVDFNAIDSEDEDGDGVLDLWDECVGTPPGVKVTARGCPVDEDDDGIATYSDKETTSAPRAIVDLEGVTYTEERLIADSKTPDAVPSDRICEYYPSLCADGTGMKKFKTYYMEIPEKFKPVDLNNDGYISVEELNLAIDKFFDFGTNYTIEDIYELNDFFFEQ